MHTEARKLFIIEAVLKIDNDAVLQAIETIVGNDMVTLTKGSNSRFTDLIGTITAEEAESMKQTIDENFEQINPDHWK